MSDKGLVLPCYHGYHSVLPIITMPSSRPGELEDVRDLGSRVVHILYLIL